MTRATVVSVTLVGLTSSGNSLIVAPEQIHDAQRLDAFHRQQGLPLIPYRGDGLNLGHEQTPNKLKHRDTAPHRQYPTPLRLLVEWERERLSDQDTGDDEELVGDTEGLFNVGRGDLGEVEGDGNGRKTTAKPYDDTFIS